MAGRAYAEYDKREPQRLDADGYMEEDFVEVYSFGRWYYGRVTKVGRSLVHVRYSSRSGPERVKGFPAARVRLLKSVKARGDT